jgi:hypothetical protein
VPPGVTPKALNVYDVPVVKPLTTIGDEAPVFEKQPGVETTL